MLKNLKNQKGFTLIEILVVIGIIAVLAAIVLIAINPARQFQQARDTQRRSDTNAILNAIGQYVADNKGSVPSGITADGAWYTISSAGGVDLCTPLVSTVSYISAFPVDPNTTSAGLGKGDAVPKANCANYTTGYSVKEDTAANGSRISVKGISEVTGSDIIVTR